jgi:hypothetical protein
MSSHNEVVRDSFTTQAFAFASNPSVTSGTRPFRDTDRRLCFPAGAAILAGRKTDRWASFIKKSIYLDTVPVGYCAYGGFPLVLSQVESWKRAVRAKVASN